MPISCVFNQGESYFTSRWENQITDDEMLEAFTTFFNSSESVTGLNKLVDLTDLDSSGVTYDGLSRLAEQLRLFYLRRGLSQVKSAVCAPRDLEFGMARVYQVYAGSGPERVKVFRNKEDALVWLSERSHERSESEKLCVALSSFL